MGLVTKNDVMGAIEDYALVKVKDIPALIEKTLGLNWKDLACRWLMKKIDSDGSGDVDVEEFRAVLPDVFTNRTAEFCTNVMNDFGGKVPKDQVLDVMEALGADAEETAYDLFIEHFGDYDGELHLSPFHQKLQEISSAADEVLRTTFDKYSKDGGNSMPLDISAVEGAIRCMGQQPMVLGRKVLLNKFDTSGDGIIDMSEFAAVYQEITGRAIRGMSVKFIFRGYAKQDGDKTGVSAQDISEIISHHLEKGGQFDMDKVILDYFDKDKNGQISFEEFKQAWESVQNVPWKEHTLADYEARRNKKKQKAEVKAEDKKEAAK